MIYKTVKLVNQANLHDSQIITTQQIVIAHSIIKNVSISEEMAELKPCCPEENF